MRRLLDDPRCFRKSDFGMRIAIIGTGIGGLSAAWLLGAEHEVSLYERLPSLGMAAHGIELGDGPDRVRADVPLRVIYESYYPSLMALYRQAEIETTPVDYSGSFAELGGPTYFRYRNRLRGRSSLPYLWGREALRPTTWQIVRDLARFYLRAPRDLREGRLEGATIGDYLAREGYSRLFVERFVLPTFAAIGTCSYASVRDYPARVIVEYLTKGVLLEGVRRTVRGADHVVARLSSRIRESHCGVSIDRLERLGDEVEVLGSDGSRRRFDHVVVATQASQVLKFLVDPTPTEARVLESFRYERSRVVVHRDTDLAPARRKDWAPVNFFVSDLRDRPMATIWLNAVLPVPAGVGDVFQTWNPIVDPKPETVMANAEFDRPVVDAESDRVVGEMDRLHAEPGRRVWSCGSYARRGAPLLESAAASAMAVAQRLEAAGPVA